MIHHTYSVLLDMLHLSDGHRAHLTSPKRGLSQEQNRQLRYKSTPLPFLCRSITDRLIKQGCKVQGVPGFYLDSAGRWTLNFSKRTAGILIPARSIDGLICGMQILLDVPIREKDAPPDKTGAKYIWLSSASKPMGQSRIQESFKQCGLYLQCQDNEQIIKWLRSLVDNLESTSTDKTGTMRKRWTISTINNILGNKD